MGNTDQSLIIQTLKEELKKANFTYKKVAGLLELSEVSVKRIFSKNDCSLGRLNEIANLIGLSFTDLAKITLQKSSNQNYFFSHKQDHYFSKHPYLFYFFRELYKGVDLITLQQNANLTDTQVEKYLKSLEKLELIERTASKKFRFLISGQLRLSLDGDFFEKIIKTQNLEFLESVYANIKDDLTCFQSSEVKMSKQAQSQMVQEIHQIGRKYRERSYQDEKTLTNEDLVDVRWLFAFKAYKTPWQYRYDA